MIPGIWSMMDRICCHCGPFFAHLPPPPSSKKKKNTKNQNFNKIKKAIRDMKKKKIMIICYTVPEIWCMTADVTVIFHFGIFFVPPHPPNSLKNENFTKMKKRHRDIIILHKYTKSHDHMVYCSWDMACDRCNFYFSFCFGLFFALLPSPPNLLKKWKFQKNEKKKLLEISSFYTSVQKLWLDDAWFLKYGVRQTDRWMAKVTYRCACPT